MQEEYLRENFKKVLEYYPTLVEHTIYFKVYSKKIIAEYKSKARCLMFIDEKFSITPDSEQLCLAEDYRIQKRDGKYYCLKGDQTGKFHCTNL